MDDHRRRLTTARAGRQRRRPLRQQVATWAAVALLAVAAGCGRDPVGATSVTAPAAPTGAVSVTGLPATPTPVGPAAGTPLAGIDRDAGISVRLSDGSVMWFFGDSAIHNPDDSLKFFVIGTAAWAPAAVPTVTRDHVLPNGWPVKFATPTVGFPSCPTDIPVKGMWPSSAVSYRVGKRDRIVVWLENICLGEGAREVGVGASVAEVWYDPAHPPANQPVVARILNQQLFPRRGFGLAATLGDHHDAYVYSCDAPAAGGWPTQYGPCRVARVDLDHVADPAEYRVWSRNGSWMRLAIAKPMSMDMPSADVKTRYPAASVSVTKDPAAGRYVMAYSPWPVRSVEVVLRFADRPEGPWTEPTEVPLAGCNDTVGTTQYSCYAGTAQPVFSTPGHLGIGYYDRMIAANPVVGSYFVTTVPVTATKR